MLSFSAGRSSLALTFSLLFASGVAQADIQVLSSIKPLSLIAAEVVGDKGEAVTLLPVAASPHDYPLKVSDIRRLREADLVLWVGKELEGFLHRPLANVDGSKQMAVFNLKGLYWPNAVESEDHDHDHDHDDHHHNHGHDHFHHHDGKDPHLWLDPRNAGVIATELAARLAVIDPQNAAVFTENARRFLAKIEQIDAELQKQMQPLRNKGFAVYHEGYQHFVDRYQLLQVGYVTYSPEQRPGAKHLYQLRQKLQGDALCLFTEPYYDQRIARELGQELKLKIGVLDPIGCEAVVNYQQLIENMAKDFSSCLE
jgi:zinc transport system substrate-binding protein